MARLEFGNGGIRKVMKRLAIFVFYDFQGIVDEYVEYLLLKLAGVVDEITIISNGYLGEEAKDILKKYSKRVYERENIGFDAGAYKDAFTLYLKDVDWRIWDEVIMLNDTFYGPIYPFELLLDKMDKQNIDFWGLTKFEDGMWEDGRKIPCHLQSYFLGVRKTLLCSNAFYAFWKEMNYFQVIEDAIWDFEVKFTDWFSGLGFRYIAYTDITENGYIEKKGTNVYYTYTYELVAKSRVPVIKRKSLYSFNYVNAAKAIDYIKNNTLYEVELIEKHIERLDDNNQIKPFGYKRLREFCGSFSKIYIYGYGKCGHEVKKYMDDEKLRVEKYVVTNKEHNFEDVISIDELVIDENTGIILAMGKNNAEQVYELLQKVMSSRQLLAPQY